MSRRLVVALAAIAALSLTANASAAQKKNHVKIVGSVLVKPNKFVQDNQRFKTAGKTAVVQSGGQLTYANRAKTPDPHTISLVQSLPKTAEAIFGCEACGAFFGAHQFDEETGEIGQPTVFGDGAGFSAPGDSVVIGPKGSPEGTPQPKGSIPVTAEAGSTLKFLCAIHPWMQGKVKVK